MPKLSKEEEEYDGIEIGFDDDEEDEFYDDDFVEGKK